MRSIRSELVFCIACVACVACGDERDREAKVPDKTAAPAPRPASPASAPDDAKPLASDFTEDIGEAANGLSQAQVMTAVRRLHRRIDKCGADLGGGEVSADLRIDPTGRLASVTVEPPGELAMCVARVLRRARFPESSDGGTFTIPWSFDDGDLMSGGSYTKRRDISHLPKTLSRSQVMESIAATRDGIDKCAARVDAKGVVTVELLVGAGRVVSAKVVSSPNDELGRCVLHGVRQAVFPEAQKSVKFTLPIDLR